MEKAILHGCTAVEDASRGATGLQILLQWKCRPTNGGVETCDGVDNDCNDLVDDGNPVYLCPQVSQAQASDCRSGLCQYDCLPGWFNPNGTWADGCECRLIRSEEWCDGLDNDCDGQTDEADCRACLISADCLDPGYCLEGPCEEGHCRYTPVTAGTPCDDGLFCTVDDACTADGQCQGSPRSCPEAPVCQQAFCDEPSASCAIRPLEDDSPCPDDGIFCNGVERCRQGECRSSGNPCPGPDGDSDCAESCDEAERHCHAPDPGKTPCEDGLACTAADSCDDTGHCLSGFPDHSACPDAGICLPECAESPSGCVPAGVLTLSCPEGAGDTVICSLNTEPGRSGLAACLTCEAHLVQPLLDQTDFEADGQPGVCSTEAWSVETQAVCSRRLQTCPLQVNLPYACCRTPACPVVSAPLFGRMALEFGKSACPEEAFRLYRTFDLRAFDQATFCLDVGHVGSASPYKFAQLQTEPGGEFFCQRANASPELPENGLGRLCAALPSQAFSSSSARLDIWLQTDSGAWIIDNPWLQAGYQNCTPTTREAFRETFTDCSGEVQGSWNGWSIAISGNPPSCQNLFCPSNALILQRGTVVLERQIDTRSLAYVWLCWKAAAIGAGHAGNTLLVEFDDGTGWRSAYDVEGELVTGPSDTCQRNCVDLSLLSQQAAGNPSLGLRLTATLIESALVLDDIAVQGPDTCAAGDRLLTETITEEPASPGSYRVTVRNVARKNFPVLLECRLGGDGAWASTLFTFQIE